MDEFRVIIPSEFQLVSGLDTFEAKYNLRKLREAALPDDDLEIRIHVWGRPAFETLIITRTSGNWAARHFPWAVCDAEGNFTQPTNYDLPPPKSGWAIAWEELKAAGLLSLSGVKQSQWNDGLDFVVETNLNKTYLLYEFTDPEHIKDPQAKQMMKIGDVVAEEFGLKAFQRDFSCSQ